MLDIYTYINRIPAVKDASMGKETMWLNEHMIPFDQASLEISLEQIKDAEDRLARFAPYIARVFPETGDGIIESPFREIPNMKKRLEQKYGIEISGHLYIKLDSELPVTGSVKARGGIYEVLKHAETLAMKQGMLKETDDYSILAEPEFQSLFRQYKVQVGSTGNLGLSIGIMSAQLGFQVIVHMSRDAKQWKKDLLRQKGVTVIEYADDYCGAVARGREESDKDPASYFVDDEKSTDLFLGYTVAGHRLQKQLEDNGIIVDDSHPMFVTVPCGIGGAPGGVSYGLKHIFKDNVHCFFAEPTEACCMLLGLATGLNDQVCVQDFGIGGKTDADGLAVTRPSSLVCRVIAPLISGNATITDERLYDLMRDLYETEGIFIEPSSCACFATLLQNKKMKQYEAEHGVVSAMTNAVQVVWATGGSLVPEKEKEAYLNHH